MKITDVKCAVIGGNPIVRITTDSGIDGLGQAHSGASPRSVTQPLPTAVPTEHLPEDFFDNRELWWGCFLSACLM